MSQLDVYPTRPDTVLDGSYNGVHRPKYMDISGTVLNFTLLDFDQTMFLDVSGVLSKSRYDPSFSKYDAISEIDVSLVHFRNMFAIESDSDHLIDLSLNSVLDNVHFIVYSHRIDEFIPNLGDHSKVVTGTVQEKNSMGLHVEQNTKLDFIRYLAYLLFNTPYAAELFVNEEELVSSAASAINLAWTQCRNKLRYVATDASYNHNLKYDTSGNYYYLNDSLLTDASGNGISNICGELYKQIVSNDPERFNDTNTLETVDNSYNSLGGKQYYLPFIKNDVITIRVTLHPAHGQNLFGLTYSERSASFDPLANQYLKPKVYLIKMRLTAD
jgi:hypothetical protein